MEIDPLPLNTKSFIRAALDKAVRGIATKAYQDIVKQDLPTLSAMYDYTGMMPASVSCPTCNGTGRTTVGLIGFNLDWEADCPDCDGCGTVGFLRARKLRDSIDRRLKQGFPRTPPSGGY